MNILEAFFAKIFGGKKPDPMPDYSERMTRLDRANGLKLSSYRAGKSHGAPSRRVNEASRQQDDIMSNPLHPLNPISPISVYNDYTPSESSRSDCSDYSGSSSSSYDSGSSSCDSGSSSSSSD